MRSIQRVFFFFSSVFICVHLWFHLISSSNMLVEFPGFFDLQVNGFGGVDFNDPGCTPEQLKSAVDALRKTGVTRFLPTLITSTLARLSSCPSALPDLHDSSIAGVPM